MIRIVVVLLALLVGAAHAAPMPFETRQQNGVHYFPDGIKGPVYEFGGGEFSPLAFGAKCDGSTDDTVALTQAVTQAVIAGGWVTLPDGGQECLFSTTITVVSAGPWGIKGVGRPDQNSPTTTGSRLRFNGSGFAFVLSGGNTNGVTFQDFYLEIDAPSSGAFDYVDPARFVTVERVHVEGPTTGEAFHMDGQISCNCFHTWKDVRVRNFGTGWRFSGFANANYVNEAHCSLTGTCFDFSPAGADTLGGNDNTVERTEINGSTTLGINLGTADRNTFIAVVEDGNLAGGGTNTSLAVDANSDHNVFVGCTLPDNSVTTAVAANQTFIGTRYSSTVDQAIGAHAGLHRLFRVDSPETCNANLNGAFYMDDSLGEQCICNGTAWCRADGVCGTNTSCGTTKLPAAQSVLAGLVTTITADVCNGGMKRVTSTGAFSTNTTNTFTAPASAPVDCRMVVCNVGSNAITLDSNANFIPFLPTSDIELGPGNCVPVVNDGTAWRQEAAFLDNVSQNGLITNLFTQFRVLASNGGNAGGIDVDASGLSTGIGIIVENNRSVPLTVDTAYPFWIGTDGNGTAAADGAITSMGMEVHDDTPGDDSVFAFRRSRGTHASPTVVQAGDILGTLVMQGYDGQAGAAGWTNGPQGGVVGIEAYAAQTYSSTAHGASMKFFTTPTTASAGLVTSQTLTTSGNAVLNGLRVDGDAANGNDPTARLHVIEPLGSGITMQKLETTVSGDDIIESTTQCKFQTTDATANQVACSIPVVSGRVITASAMIVARCHGGGTCGTATGAGYRISMSCKNVGGTTSAVGAVDVDVTQEDTVGWDASMDCNDAADTVRVLVTGAGTSNIAWAMTVRSMDMGS